MTVYLVKPRKRDERGVFAIMRGRAELGRLKARTHTEAVTLARRKGIGDGQQIYALEIVEESRIVSEI